MSDIRFYHMEKSSLEQVLPSLLSKALQGGHRIIVKGTNEAQIENLNGHLWSYDAHSFLPHGTVKDGHEQVQPIWLTYENDNPNEAGVLILINGALCEDAAQFSMVCEMLDGRDSDAISAARGRWKIYKEQGHDVTYWQQSEAGKWEKKV